VRLRELVIDAWSWHNYNRRWPTRAAPATVTSPRVNSSWVPEPDRRRLAAYKLLAEYDSNQAGQLAAVTGDHQGVERRELGDPPPNASRRTP
jgi:hypothetical protein